MDEVIVVGAGISGLASASLLAHDGVPVRIFESSAKVGGRTASMIYKNHILDNGFHIMPFYKTSAVYRVLQRLGLVESLELAKVDSIAFYRRGFHVYPRGIGDILKLSLVPFRSRLGLLRILLPLAFSSYGAAESMDDESLGTVTKKLDEKSRSFFDAVCMLAFADIPERVSLGEFARTMIRANPFRGGTSEFAYPAAGGYDTISKTMASYVERRGGTLHLSTSAEEIVVEDGRIRGVRTASGDFYPSRCVIVSLPAYIAIEKLFERDVFDAEFRRRIGRLNKTTSVVEVHYCTSRRIDTRQIVFPVGDEYTAKGIFFVSNIAPRISPPEEHLIISGTPVPPDHASDADRIRETAERMRSDISGIYPAFRESLLWERPMAWRLVEATVKEPGMVWKQKAPHSTDAVSGLFFVGDSTISHGIGTDSAAHSSLLCHPKILGYLRDAKCAPS